MTVSCFLKKVARRSWSRQYFDGVWGARRRGLDSTPLFPVHEFVGFRSMAWRVCEGEHFACLSVSFFFFPTLTPVYSRNTARPAAVSPLYDTTFHFSTALNTCSRCSSARRLYFGFVVRTYSFALPHLPRNADDVGHMYVPHAPVCPCNDTVHCNATSTSTGAQRTRRRSGGTFVESLHA